VYKKHPGGRPRYEPTEADRNTVKTMVACGITQDDIAHCLGADGVAPKTLRLHFRNELDTEMTQVNALAGSQVIAAMKRGEAWACCFWLKCRAGWQETSAHRFVNEQGRDRPFLLGDADRLVDEADEEISSK